MARMVGERRRRFGGDSVRMATTAGAVALAVLAIYGAIRAIGAGLGVIVATPLLFVVGAALVVGKLLLDHRLVGSSGGRRAEDTAALAALLAGLSDSWWVFSDFFLAGTAVEFLVVGPGGAFSVEVYHWLVRETGTGFHERMTADLMARTSELETALARLTGLGDALRIQPVYFCPETEGLRLGEILLHPSAPDLRHVQGVIFAVPTNVLALIRAGGPQHGVRTRGLDADRAARLARFLQERTGAAPG